MNTYEATVKVRDIPMSVTVQAENTFKAQLMLEGQYGKENVLTMPRHIL